MEGDESTESGPGLEAILGGGREVRRNRVLVRAPTLRRGRFLAVVARGRRRVTDRRSDGASVDGFGGEKGVLAVESVGTRRGREVFRGEV